MAYDAEQRRNIALALRMTRGDSRRVRQALLEAGLVESHWHHLHGGDRDSQGVLQQRPSQGWGPYIPGVRGVKQDIMDFLVRARRADRGFRGTPGQLAQAVQRSAYPDRYDEHAGEAQSLLGGRMASSPGMNIAGRLRGSQSAPGVSQPAAVNPMVMNLLQTSNELAQGRMPDSSRLLEALVASRQMAEQPSEPAQSVAASVNYGAPRGGGITYSGQKLTHDTDGLAGYPAIDLFAKPGTSFDAPEDGQIVRHSGRGGTSGNVFGYSVYFKGNSGKEYFITHLGPNRAPVGARLRKGQRIGRVSKWAGGSPHAHVGIHG